MAALAFVFVHGCNRVADHALAVESHLSGDASVGFDLEPLQSGDASQQWIGIYKTPGKIARFRIDFGPAESTPGTGVKSGEGTLIPEPGSDSSVLLVDLQKALGARTAPKAPLTKTSIPFTYVNIGDNLAKASTGDFSANPPGNWTALKLIFGEGNRESEIFLHINARATKGQFSMKDSAHADLALAELAKVL